MSETKFTPGPWEFNAHDGSLTDSTEASNEIGWIQIEDWHHLGMGLANANLIAAAPELYDALVGMADLLKNHAPTVWRHKKEYIDALEALAKARGEV